MGFIAKSIGLDQKPVPVPLNQLTRAVLPTGRKEKEKGLFEFGRKARSRTFLSAGRQGSLLGDALASAASTQPLGV